MSNERQYTKVSGGSDNKRWEPNKSTTVIDPKNPPKIEGYYTKVNPDMPGPNGPFAVHTIQTLETHANHEGALGEAFDVSLGAVIDDVLSKIKIGSFICIIYKGKKPSKTPGRTYNDVDVFVDNNAIPFSELNKSAADDTHQERNSIQAEKPQPFKDVAAKNNSPFPDEDDLPF